MGALSSRKLTNYWGKEGCGNCSLLSVLSTRNTTVSGFALQRLSSYLLFIKSTITKTFFLFDSDKLTPLFCTRCKRTYPPKRQTLSNEPRVYCDNALFVCTSQSPSDSFSGSAGIVNQYWYQFVRVIEISSQQGRPRCGKISTTPFEVVRH